MKYSVAAAALALASGVVAKPQITNSAAINPEEGKAFTLQLSGCSAGCTVYLMQGPKDGQVPVKVLDSAFSLPHLPRRHGFNYIHHLEPF